MAAQDPWDVLETKRADGIEAAKRAWRELVALYHPDHHADMPRRRAGPRRGRAATSERGVGRDPRGGGRKPPTRRHRARGRRRFRLRQRSARSRRPTRATGRSTSRARRSTRSGGSRQATKAANLTVKTAADNTVVITRGSFGSKDGVVIELLDNDGETECRDQRRLAQPRARRARRACAPPPAAT